MGSGGPWFGVDKDLKDNRLLVAQGKDHLRLYSSACRISNLHWIGEAGQRQKQFSCMAKFRYRQSDQPVEITVEEGANAYIKYITPQRAVTPGQFAVLYDGDICLGGGVIDSIEYAAFY